MQKKNVIGKYELASDIAYFLQFWLLTQAKLKKAAL